MTPLGTELALTIDRCFFFFFLLLLDRPRAHRAARAIAEWPLHRSGRYIFFLYCASSLRPQSFDVEGHDPTDIRRSFFPCFFLFFSPLSALLWSLWVLRAARCSARPVMVVMHNTPVTLFCRLRPSRRKVGERSPFSGRYPHTR